MQNDHTTDKHHEWRFVDPFQSYQNSGIHLIGSIKWNVGYHLIELIIGMPIIEPLFLVLHYSDVDSHVHSYSDIRLTVVATFVICTNQCVPFCISATYFWALNRTDRNQGKFCQSLHNPFNQCQQISTMFVELQDRLRYREKSDAYSNSIEELSEGGSFPWWLGKLIEIGVQSIGLFIAHITLDAIPNHIHSPLKAIVLDISRDEEVKQLSLPITEELLSHFG